MKTRYFIFGLLFYLNVWAQDKPQTQLFDPSTIIPIDSATLGYTVNNEELGFKEHVALPKNKGFKGGGMIDSRYRLTNLIADEQGTYEQDKVKKIVIVDTQTGEIKPTPYEGTIACFVDGNLATFVQPGRVESWTFSFGKYGEMLQTWKGMYEPEGMHLNLMSCKLQPQDYGRTRKDGTYTAGVNLRYEHGGLLVIPGQNLPGNAPNVSPDVQRLMQQPFMQNMTLPAHSEQWIFKKPNGEEILIPNNPGEAADSSSVTYLPYINAYFMALKSRPFVADDMQRIPKYSRIFYPDGRVVRYGVPDVIWQPCVRHEIGCQVLYTKAGLVWRIQFVRIDRVGRTNYKGELKEGYYLDQPGKKTLTKIPDLSATSQRGLLTPFGLFDDGCRVQSREEITQKQPHILFNVYYINLCTGE